MKPGVIIREKRKEQSLTQEQLANLLGVSATAVHKWEKGNHISGYHYPASPGPGAENRSEHLAVLPGGSDRRGDRPLRRGTEGHG